MKSKKSIMVLILCCLLLGFIVSAYGVESTTVSCYAGDPDNSVNLGSVEVFIVSNAPNVCNHVFADCNGNCTACYINKDSLQSLSTHRKTIYQAVNTVN